MVYLKCKLREINANNKKYLRKNTHTPTHIHLKTKHENAIFNDNEN